MNTDKSYFGRYVTCLRADESSLVGSVPRCAQQIVHNMAAQLLIRQNWLCLSSTCVFRGKAASHMFLGTAKVDWRPYCTSGVKNARHPRGCPFILFVTFHFFIIFSTSCDYWREAKGSRWTGGSPGASRSTGMYRITLPLPPTAAHWNMYRTWTAAARYLLLHLTAAMLSTWQN